MIKSIRVLKKINGVNGFYFESDVAMDKFVEQRSLDCHYTARKVLAVTVGAKQIKIVQEDGSIQMGYVFGSYTWSYDKKEIEEYSTAWHKEEAEKRARNKALKENV